MFLSKKNPENLILFLFFAGTFILLILLSPIYSPDTYSYLHVDVFRFPGYVLFIRGFQFVFGGFFDTAIVGFQLLLGFVSVFKLYKNCSSLLKLNTGYKVILFLVLVLPYFTPSYIANNLASEGISYPFYLLFISFVLDFLYRDQSHKIIHLSIAFILLNLTRGQFIILAPILAFLYIIKYKKGILRQRRYIKLFVIVLLPILTMTLDSSYRKIVHGFFITTPYSYVNSITLPLFVSQKEDRLDFENEDHRILFTKSYNTIDSLNLLSSKINGSYQEKYKVFHDNFPIICNQNIHVKGMAYYRNANENPHHGSVLTEKACKEMFPILIRNNFKEWLTLYFTGFLYGYKSIFIFLFILGVLIYSSWVSLKSFTLENSLLLLATLLIISNSLIIALASHTISRYLFYNYFFLVVIVVLILRKIKLKI
ncbi:MAG: hypothetical protein H0X63_05105 [Flavobacteriales bacterium]|nr:hypothetical protein [Flavobacteriales bacterium]